MFKTFNINVPSHKDKFHKLMFLLQIKFHSWKFEKAQNKYIQNNLYKVWNLFKGLLLCYIWGNKKSHLLEEQDKCFLLLIYLSNIQPVWNSSKETRS